MIFAGLFGLSGKQWAPVLALAFGLAFLMVGILSVRKGTVPHQFGFVRRADWPFHFWALVVMWFGIGAGLVSGAIYMFFFPD